MNTLAKINSNPVWGVFQDFMNEVQSFNPLKSNLPDINIEETQKEYEIEVAAPGMTKEDFKIDVIDNILKISSTKEEKEEEEKENYSRKRFYSSFFEKSLRLPENALVDEISAKCENGILSVTIPKKEIVGKSKKTIQIQ